MAKAKASIIDKIQAKQTELTDTSIAATTSAEFHRQQVEVSENRAAHTATQAAAVREGLTIIKDAGVIF